MGKNRIVLITVAVAIVVILYLYRSSSHLNVEPHAREEIEKAKQR
jgi:hypothetical protein